MDEWPHMFDIEDPGISLTFVWNLDWKTRGWKKDKVDHIHKLHDADYNGQSRMDVEDLAENGLTDDSLWTNKRRELESQINQEQ